MAKLAGEINLLIIPAVNEQSHIEVFHKTSKVSTLHGGRERPLRPAQGHNLQKMSPNRGQVIKKKKGVTKL